MSNPMIITGTILKQEGRKHFKKKKGGGTKAEETENEPILKKIYQMKSSIVLPYSHFA